MRIGHLRTGELAFFFFEEEVGSGEGEILSLEDLEILGVVGAELPEIFWEVAVVRARKLTAAGTPLHFGFEGSSGVFANFRGIFAVERFEVAVEGVLADAVF